MLEATKEMSLRIWIDLENAPHSLFFRPIIKEFESRSIEVFLTARDFSQTIDLAHDFGLNPVCIGQGVHSNYTGKVYGTLHRALQLYTYFRGQKIDFALSHGSRAQVIASRLLGITSYACFDYDHTDTKLFHILCANVFVPEVAINSFRNIKRVRKDFFFPYPGIKEEVYLEYWPIDSSVLTSLGLDVSQIIAVLRTPASLAHYKNSKSDELFDLALDHLLQHPNLCLIILPRYETQKTDLFNKYGSERRVVIPTHAIDAISLMAFADIVVSGGGTMNREAALLGTPVYSVFAGPIGTIDSILESEGRLVIIRQPNDLGKIEIRKKNHYKKQIFPKKRLSAYIVQQIIELHRQDHKNQKITE